jgi:hypothetical protein
MTTPRAKYRLLLTSTVPLSAKNKEERLLKFLKNVYAYARSH